MIYLIERYVTAQWEKCLHIMYACIRVSVRLGCLGILHRMNVWVVLKRFRSLAHNLEDLGVSRYNLKQMPLPKVIFVS